MRPRATIIPERSPELRRRQGRKATGRSLAPPSLGRLGRGRIMVDKTMDSSGRNRRGRPQPRTNQRNAGLPPRNGREPRETKRPYDHHQEASNTLWKSGRDRPPGKSRLPHPNSIPDVTAASRQRAWPRENEYREGPPEPPPQPPGQNPDISVWFGAARLRSRRSHEPDFDDPHHKKERNTAR